MQKLKKHNTTEKTQYKSLHNQDMMASKGYFQNANEIVVLVVVLYF